jgi:hypothetical protein
MIRRVIPKTPIPYGIKPAMLSITLLTLAYHPVSVAYCSAKKNNAPKPSAKKKKPLTSPLDKSLVAK